MKQTLTILFVALFFLGFTVSKPFGKQKTRIYSDTSKFTKFPKSIGFVNDFENDFTSEQRAELDSLIKSFKNKTSNEIAIVSIESIYPYKDFTNYSLELFNTWGIGRADTDNGLLILFSKKLRFVQITPGKGAERTLNDAICKKIIDEKMLPNFKKSLYYEGVKEGLREVLRVWK